MADRSWLDFDDDNTSLWLTNVFLQILQYLNSKLMEFSLRERPHLYRLKCS